MTLIVTSYENPDLDGFACTYAYTEYLRKHGKDAIGVLFGEETAEIRFMRKEFSIAPLGNGEGMLGGSDVILVDASDIEGIPGEIDRERVVEIIDHRKVHEAHAFPNAKARIELVGAAATLVAERFMEDGTPIGAASAALLYGAILSNTIGFKADVTTPRDREAARFLAGKFPLSDGLVERMFRDKSRLRKPLREAIEEDLASFTLARKRVGIAQLELVDVETFVGEAREALRAALRGIKRDGKFDLFFLTMIDTLAGGNTLVVPGQEEEPMLAAALGIAFHDGVARRPGIIMRKRIVPLVKAHLEKEDEKKEV